MMNKCMTCMFWGCHPSRRTEDQEAECRRNPPAAFVGDYRAFPVVYGRDWCGAYAPGRPFSMSLLSSQEAHVVPPE